MNLYTLALFMFIAHSKVRVFDMGERSGCHSDMVGYGVVKQSSYWRRDICGFAAWLKDPEQCPTDNQFIRRERERLARTAARGSAAPQY